MVARLDTGTVGVGEQGQVDDAGNPGIVLSVLTSIERDSAITQRALARELGIAPRARQRLSASMRAQGFG